MYFILSINTKFSNVWLVAATRKARGAGLPVKLCEFAEPL
jgi:hypothetical protein